jgi:hypothetical protein
MGKERRRNRSLNDLAGVHDNDVVRHASDDTQVVGNEDDRHTTFGLKSLKQFEDLTLDGHIQRRRWLVRHEQERLLR